MSTSTYYSFIPTAAAAKSQNNRQMQRKNNAKQQSPSSHLPHHNSSIAVGNIKSNISNMDDSVSHVVHTMNEVRRETAVSPASLATASSASNSSSSLNQFSSLTPPVSIASSTTTVSSSSASSTSSSSSSSLCKNGSSNAQRGTDVLTTTNPDPATNRKLINASPAFRRQSSSTTPTQSLLIMATTTPALQQQKPEESIDGFTKRTLNQPIRRTTSPQLFHSYTLYSLEPKPLKPFKSSSDYLEAMKEDLAEWLNTLYTDLDLNVDNFFSQLETGTIICRHANNVTQLGRNTMISEQNNSLTNTATGTTSSITTKHANTTADCNNHENNCINTNTTSLLNSPSPDSVGVDDHSIISSTYSSSNKSSSCLPNNIQQTSHITKTTNKQRTMNQMSSSSFMSDCSSLPISSPLSLSPTPTAATNPIIRDTNNTSLPRSNSSSSNNSSLDNRAMINWYRVKMIPYKQNARAGTFFARDNICQFILWCRSLNIHECLLFETDDLVARKNEKSFILCLLEVARIGCKVGMPTPLIIQLEQEIDKEIENDAKLQRQLELERQQELRLREEKEDCSNGDEVLSEDQNSETDETLAHNVKQVYNHEEYCYNGGDKSSDANDDNGQHFSCDSQEVQQQRQVGHTKSITVNEDESENEEFGPKPQVITNDLLTLHERVVQLLCQCTCATQFPMVRIGDGKYKVGDKMIIFVRILRRHIMVRVGGGWQEFSEFLRQKDPCRMKAHQIDQFNNNSPSSNGIRGSQHDGIGMSNSRSPFAGSTHYLNKYNHYSHQKNSAGQRLISGSASMDWLSHNT